MQSVKMEQGTEQDEAADLVNLSEPELVLIGGGAGGISGTGHDAIGFGGGIHGTS